jgi:hypothetical protein
MMKNTLAALVIACITIAASPAIAETATPAKKVVKQAVHKKAPVPANVESVDEDDDSREPDITGTAVTEFHCELGNKLTIFRNEGDEKYMALRWNKRVHRMTRVGTTTGAIRFENKRYGLVWIGIPAKGILLNAKIGQQLANECKDDEQMKVKSSVASGTAALS